MATHHPDSLAWQHSHALGADVVSAVRALKHRDGPDLVTQGSSALLHQLLASDVVDELRLLTYPVLLGHGKRLFDDQLAALEKEVPWLEIEDQRDSAEGRAVPVLPILGIVLFSFSVGAMVFLLMNLPVENRGLWVAPLPIALMGAGLAGFHYLL